MTNGEKLNLTIKDFLNNNFEAKRKLNTIIINLRSQGFNYSQLARLFNKVSNINLFQFEEIMLELDELSDNGMI